VGGQRLEQARLADLLRAQQAQAAVLDRAQRLLLALPLHRVLAVAEQREVVVGSPAQEFLRLVPAGFVDRHPAGRKAFGHLQHLFAHRTPVGDDPAHLGQHRQQRRLDVVDRVAGLAIDLHVHQRFGIPAAHLDQLARLVAGDRHHRMAQHVHADARLGQRHGHRIDQERHVVIDDLQHGVGRLPAMLLHVRVEQAHVGRAALAGARELQEIGRQRRPAVGGVQRQLVRGQAMVERVGEGDRIVLPGLAGALADGVEDGGQHGRDLATGLAALAWGIGVARGGTGSGGFALRTHGSWIR